MSRAIVRPPGVNFGQGLTTAKLGAPDYSKALAQHDAYCAALEHCGLTLTRLVADPRFPDSTFVEDTAVVSEDWAILARHGASSRMGEAEAMKTVLCQLYSDLNELDTPATLDGGDICEAGNHFFIGISERTNEEGANQLAQLLSSYGYSSSRVDVRGIDSILHLKSGVAYLGDNRLAVIDALAGCAEFSTYEHVKVDPTEAYAANCVRVNDHVLVAAGYPVFEQKLRKLGYKTLTVNMSEFQKMDGGLSCLSLRF